MSMASIYRPLNSSKNEIRLLRILPRRSSVAAPRTTECVQCVLRHVPLGRAKYHALSYTWLDDDLDISECEEADLKGDGVEILLDGQRVTVTHNLWLALAHFREIAQGAIAHELVEMGFDEDCWWWIDALCINQFDLDERNSQVLRMRGIYRRAETVRVWLGVDSQYPGLAIELNWKLQYAMENDASTLDMKTVLKTWVLRALEDQDLDSNWRALMWMFRRSYWRRLWIIQELLSNERTWVHIGLGIVPIKNFFYIADAIQTILANVSNKEILEKGQIPQHRSYDLANVIYASVPNLNIMLDGPKYFDDEEFPGFDLSKLLFRYRKHSCSDPRDKVYGLTGLARPYSNYELEISYSKSPDDVYKEAARFIILSSRRLEIICTPENKVCKCVSGGHSFSNLPSWVPNWACINDTVPNWKRALTMLHSRTPASYTASGDSQAQVTISTCGDILTCRGLKLGTIRKIYQIDRNEMYNSLTLNNLFQALQHVLLFVYSECQHLGLKGLPEIVVICLYQTLLNSHLVIPGESSSDFPTQVKFISDCVDVLQTLESVALCNGEDLLCLIELRHMALFACSISANQNLPVFGTGPLDTKENDTIAVLYGCDWPVLLREISNKDGKTIYEAIGELYIQGAMHGEALKTGLYEEEEIEIH